MFGVPIWILNFIELISSNRIFFFKCLLEISIHEIRSFYNKGKLLFCFVILYFLFLLPIVLAKAFHPMLTKGNDNGQPCLVPDVRRKLSMTSPLGMALAVGLP